MMEVRTKLRDSRCTKPYVFPYKVSPNLDDLPLARNGRCGRIRFERFGVSTVFHERIVPKWDFGLMEFHCDLQL